MSNIHPDFIKSILSTNIYDARTNLENVPERGAKRIRIKSCVLRALRYGRFRFAYFYIKKLASGSQADDLI